MTSATAIPVTKTNGFEVAAFEYTALNQKGRQQRGVLEADSARHARQLLREKDLLPTKVESSATERTIK